MIVKKSLLFALRFFAVVSMAAAIPAHAQELPPGAAEAEDAQQWNKAIAIYKKALTRHPTRYDLWERIADIEAECNKPAKAEVAMNEALKIKPHNVTFLLKHAQFAEWAGDNAGAERSYRTVIQLKPKDDKTRLELGTVLSWDEKTKESIAVIEPYIGRHPKNKKTLLLLSQLYMWNGDLDKSAVMIERYRKVAGEDKEYKKVKMQLLANANKNTATVKAADTLLLVSPKDCDAYTAKATALGVLRQLKEMIKSLTGADKYCKDKTAEILLDRKLLTPVRSDVRADFTYSTDSDTVEIGTYTLDGRYKINPESYLLLGAEKGWLQASATSGLNTIAGNGRIDQSAAWIGLEKMVTGNLWLNGRLGYHEAGNGLQTTPVAHGGAELRPADTLTLNYDINHDFYSVSPRAVSEGIKLTDNQVQASWHITPATTFDVKTNYGVFSDDNNYWSAVVTPRHSIITGEKLNVDLSVSGQWTSFANSVADGYYDPTSFSQYMVGTDISYAFNVDNKIGITAATGYDKDDTMSGYKRANNYALEGDFGLYRDWMLHAHAGHSDSIGINSQQYRVEDYTTNLTRRF